MIIRILGEGQYSVTDAQVDELNFLDDQLLAAADSGDDTGFGLTLRQILDTVRYRGTALPADALVPSDLVLPDEGSDVRLVKAMLRDDGLIPG
ncbi:PspA-associated protein PspAA [Nocardia brasiliensis]|uniref:PspA-associated protein PspAA n=1 Tax=Nocardia brasiliensis TaxID=37326 RepID=UPI0004A6C571|nr:hypothetical protein [Nocardia brasiliensis]